MALSLFVVLKWRPEDSRAVVETSTNLDDYTLPPNTSISHRQPNSSHAKRSNSVSETICDTLGKISQPRLVLNLSKFDLLHE